MESECENDPNRIRNFLRTKKSKEVKSSRQWQCRTWEASTETTSYSSVKNAQFVN